MFQQLMDSDLEEKILKKNPLLLAFSLLGNLELQLIFGISKVAFSLFPFVLM
jgi:hypothetical protein